MSSLQPSRPTRTRASGYNGSAPTIDQLFNRVRKDDPSAFESIFRKNFPALCSYSYRFVMNRQVAEEIVDDVFYNLWKNRKRIRITSSFHAYLATSVRNKSLDFLRKSKREKWNSALQDAEAIPCDQSIAYEAMILDELHHRIDAAVDILPPQCRIIFQMSRQQNLKYKDIARKLNISIKTVDTQIGRALKHIRKVIE